MQGWGVGVAGLRLGWAGRPGLPLPPHTHPRTTAVATHPHHPPTAARSPPPLAQVLLYPSKGEGMFVDESLIFRSDSNGEDLEGYAGAGEAGA